MMQRNNVILHSRTYETLAVRRSIALLRLDVGRPDHLASVFGFVGDDFAEIGGRTSEASVKASLA
jgi:hypothetical protein